VFKDGIGYLLFDDDSAKTRVCYNEKLVFILHAKEWNGLSNVKFTPLPGADRSTLSGGKWGNITIDDIVTSAITGYEDENLGNHSNGYKTPDMQKLMEDPNVLDIDLVRYPGFFNIPVCESVEQAKENIKANHMPDSPYWPCSEPAAFNKKGTTIVCSTNLSNSWFTETVSDQRYSIRTWGTSMLTKSPSASGPVSYCLILSLNSKKV
jgi:hypothetical protein